MVLFFPMGAKLIGPNLDLQFLEKNHFLDEVIVFDHLPCKGLKTPTTVYSFLESGQVIYDSGNDYIFPCPSLLKELISDLHSLGGAKDGLSFRISTPSLRDLKYDVTLATLSFREFCYSL